MAVKPEIGEITVEGVALSITNPSKPLWPEAGVTKLTFLEKLIQLSPYLIRHCRDRHLTTIRYPHGIHDKFFYQKNCPEPRPEFVATRVSGGIDYVVLDKLPTLLWLGNLACLEFHASFDLADDPVHPLEWVIDLDPSQEEEPRIMEAALLVGEQLAALGIESLAKTSGATGVQLIVPLADRLSFDELRSIGQFVGEYMTQKRPDLFTVERLKKHRGDRIYFDYLQHYQGKTIAAPYTPRAKPGATVSTPLGWDEIRAGAQIADFHLLNIAERLQEKGDLLEAAPRQRLRPILEFLRRR
ncbi:ATP-dependent DNA ligase clustered with Ku protein, LigD [Paenibacillus pasadenensis]|uniref:ATP-dependent DNA ligase clustered with Ku protein, LigD n=1 Tax=Paenibacillus pasadenensis TaxID=217090 RepID=A0A2N5N3B9_9BACL|nr:non-homologous end-joining DNA ligase [Paenibacillus pasadenensis]PLT44838.1 ATP-dependent DNA ligase clustered with Ku protein, LigD [Paenibacillus pasadenensis]